MFLAESYLHNLNPFAFRFTPTFGVRWYGLSYAAGFIIAWLIIRWVAKKSWSPIPAQKVGDLMFAVIIGVLLGGRIGYAIFYEPSLFVGFTNTLPYWDLLAINKGGMASHGGMIGVILAVSWFGYRNRTPIMHVLDVGALGCTPGFFFGRFANFINAELWGKPVPPQMQSYLPGQGLTAVDPPWWSVKYPQEILEHWLPTNDERLDALEPLRTVMNTGPGFYERITSDLRAGDPTVVQIVKPLLTAYYPSQIFQMFTDGLFVALLLALIWIKPRKPGVVGSWYLIIYGFMRIVAEMFRQPDAGVPLTLGLLSRGQTLSILMILAGFVCLWIMSRRNVPRLGGLFRNGSAGQPDLK